MRTAPEEGLIRRNILLPRASLNRLTNLKQRTDATSDTEVLRNALRVYEQLVEDAESGKELVLRDGESGKETTIRIR